MDKESGEGRRRRESVEREERYGVGREWGFGRGEHGGTRGGYVIVHICI